VWSTILSTVMVTLKTIMSSLNKALVKQWYR